MTEDKFSDLPPPPDPGADPLRDLHELQAQSWTEGVMTGEFWRTAPYSDFAPEYLKDAAKVGSVDQELFISICEVIATHIYRSNKVDSEAKIVLIDKFKQAGIDEPEKKVEELIEKHLAKQFINPNN